MKKYVFSFIIILLSTFIIFFIFKDNKKLKSENIALVNNDSISLEEFRFRLSEIKNNYKEIEFSNLVELKIVVLRRMIIDTLILQEARSKNITINHDEVSRYANNIRANINDEDFYQLLMQQFKTEDQWVQDLKNKLLIEKTLSKLIIEKIKLSENEIENYYTSYYLDKISKPRVALAQIFNTKKELIEEALIGIKEGENFSELVLKYSEGPEKEKGGYLGYITKDTNIDIFDLAFKMELNEVSDIIQSDYGFHIIKLLEYVPEKKITLNEAKPYIFNEIINQKEKIIYEKYIENKIKNSKILINYSLLESID